MCILSYVFMFRNMFYDSSSHFLCYAQLLAKLGKPQ